MLTSQFSHVCPLLQDTSPKGKEQVHLRMCLFLPVFTPETINQREALVIVQSQGNSQHGGKFRGWVYGCLRFRLLDTISLSVLDNDSMSISPLSHLSLPSCLWSCLSASADHTALISSLTQISITCLFCSGTPTSFINHKDAATLRPSVQGWIETLPSWGMRSASHSLFLDIKHMLTWVTLVAFRTVVDK